MFKVAAYTAGINDPSSRFRVRQYVPFLQKLDIEIDEFFPQLGAYPPDNRKKRLFWAVGTLAQRLPSIVSSYNYKVTLLQRAMLSTYTTLEPFTKKPRVLDVDDAIWLHPRGDFARRLALLCDCVICGNEFLAEQFSRWNKNVIILPTSVDTDRYYPKNSNMTDGRKIIAWSGSSSGFKYLYDIEKAIAYILNKYRDVKLRIISDRAPNFELISKESVEYIKWSSHIEVQAIQDIDIGIMPLEDSLWARGKCSYKMLTYMSCGIPVVVSPIGMNQEVLKMGNFGFGAKTTDEWIDSIEFLLLNKSNAIQMGTTARNCIVEKFSIHKLAPIFARHLLEIGG